ncbi:MAG TPA: LamG domain-containing protein [Candidatus Sulfotelmatobacter sp.]|nr:LamG domain-containing protein [Candidatus Sulfotelmatobacter sp.]
MFSIPTSAGGSRCFSGDSFLRRGRRRRLDSLLLHGLVAHWKLDEASGSRYDSAKGHHLTPAGHPTQAEGQLGFAAQFSPATEDSFSCPSEVDLQMAGRDFTIAGWVLFDSVGNCGLFGKGNGLGLEYRLGCESGYLYFAVSADGMAANTLTHSQAVESGLWYHFAAWYDSVEARIYLCLNNDGLVSASHPAGVFAGTADLLLGRTDAADSQLAGRLDSVSLWQRLLSEPERAQLYNHGSGLEYPFTQ